MTQHRLDRRRLLQAGLAAAAAPLMGAARTAVAPAHKPNILWLTAEDIGPHLGCYGDAYADSPHIDALAARGMRYQRAWSNAPVCAPARTAIITGMHPTSLGAEHMRSLVALPGFMRLFPQILGEHGYYCTNNSKEDYNIEPNGKLWDDSSGNAHWKNRAPGQPFFAVFNFTESHESRIRARPHTLRRDPDQAPVPPYHPDTPEVRHDWAQYYDGIQQIDQRVGERLAELDEAGLLDDTVVFFFGDHGSGMPRSKRWPYNAGLHVPLIVHVPVKFQHLAPDGYEAGNITPRLTSFIDLAPTVLSLAGIEPPGWMHGRAVMGPYEAQPVQHLFGYRGRMDERIDMVRSVTDGRFVYIRNYMPHLIQGQHLAYMWEMPTTRVWEAHYKAGELAPPQTHFWEPKPPEELYDLARDPHEVNNLAEAGGVHLRVLMAFRMALRDHVLATRDCGFLPEPDMHRRAGEDAIFTMAEDPERYPLLDLLSVADRAARRDSESIEEIAAGLGHPEPAFRYWLVMGLFIRGQEAVESARDVLRSALDDDSPSVRIVAAHALAEHGGEADTPRAIDTLASLASPVDNGAYVAIAALNALEALGDKASAVHPMLAGLPARDPEAPERANRYVERLIALLAPGGAE